MRKILYIIILAFIHTHFLSAQGEPQISLRNFGGGLNTNMSPLLLKPNQATILQNVYLSSEIGSIMKRWGFHAMTDTINNACDLTGIFGTVNRSGRKRMYGVIDTTTSTNTIHGLGGLFVSADFGYNLDTSLAIYPYVYTGATPYWTMWKNDVFLSNGRQVPIIVHNDSARDLVVQPPGSPRLYPMNDAPASGYGLDGEYRYAYRMISNCGSTLGQDSLASTGVNNDNGDLDDWTSGACDHWTIDSSEVGDSIVFSEEATIVRSGSAIEIQTFGVGARGYIRDSMPVTAGADYLITFYVNIAMESSASTSYISMIVKGRPSGTSLDWASKTGATSGYEILSLDIAVPAGDDSIGVEIYIMGSHDSVRAYVEDVTLQTTTLNYEESYLTQPIAAYSEKILQGNFGGLAFTVSCDTTDSCFDTLSVFEIFRTKAYPENITKLDTMYRVGAFYDLRIDTDLDTLRFIDSIPDDSLGTGSFIATHLPDFDKLGKDASGSVTGVRVGAPTYVSVNADTTNSVSFGGADTNIIVIAYMITLEDTLTGIMSDSSRNLYLFLDTTGSPFDSNFTIGLPPIPAGRNHLVRKIYKSWGFVTNLDTTAGDLTIRIDTLDDYSRLIMLSGIQPVGAYGMLIPPEMDNNYWPEGIEDLVRVIRPINRLDTNFTFHYHIATIRDSAVKTFLDATPADTILLRDIYTRTNTPNTLNQLTLFVDMLLATEGSRVYYSLLDTAMFGAVRFIALNADDGDEGTAIVAYENHIKYFKNQSQFILLPTNNPLSPFEREKVISGIGCIAPHSVVPYLNSIYYLSEHGFIREYAIPHRENTSSFDTISVLINDILLDHSPDVLRSVVGVAVPRYQEIRWSIPSIDSTFVYNTLTRGWSINTYSFNQTTYYDTTKDANIQLARDLLFITNSSDRIFKADTSVADSVQAFYLEYETPLFGIGYRNVAVPYIGVGALLNTNALGALIYTIKDAKGDSVYADSIHYPAVKSGRYRRFSAESNSEEYFSIHLRSSSLGLTFKLRQLDIWTSPSNPVEVE